VALISIATVAWWITRNWPSDDDRWKRRRKKLTEAVKQKAGRLVVVPAEVGS
jgi:hypothetical protein